MEQHRRICLFLINIIMILSVYSCAAKYELTISGNIGGSTTLTPSGGMYKANSVIVLEALPDSGYYFSGWGNISDYSIDSALDSTIEIVMPEQSIEITAGFAEPGEGWTFMIYMAGDNSLSSMVDGDIDEMERGLYSSLAGGNNQIANDIKVLVLADKYGPGNTRLYLVSADNTAGVNSVEIVDDSYPDGNELNMGDPDTLDDFITYGMVKYPSAHNALVIWNHGAGVKSLDSGTGGSREICEDGSDILYLNELQTAITGAVGSTTLDIVGMDACLMGEVETAYEMKDLAAYFVASMAEEWGYGWDYSLIFNNFDTAGDIPTSVQMAEIIVKQYEDSINSAGTSYHDTMTAVDTSKLGALKTEIDTLAELLHIESGDPQAAFQAARDSSVFYYTAGDQDQEVFWPYHDIYSFCTELESSSLSQTVKDQATAVKTVLAAAVVSAYGESNDGSFSYDTSDPAVRGLSIVIPDDNDSYEYNYTSGTVILPAYYAVWWYGAQLYMTNAGYYLGGIDFCTYDSDGTVETWRELFEAWYDDYPSENDGQGYTPGNY